MNKFLITTAIATFAAGAAFAGAVEFVAPAAPVVVAAPAPVITDWSGPYVGAMVGMDSGTHTESVYYDQDESDSYDYDLDGNSYGVFAGYNFQRDSFVFGVEAAYSMANTGFGPVEFDENEFWSGEYTSYLDLKARVGFAAGNALIYGFGGWSSAELTTKYEGDGTDTDDFTPTGYNYGAGVQMLVTDSIFVGAEYIVRELSDPAEVWDDGDDWTIDTTIQTISLRVGMQF